MPKWTRWELQLASVGIANGLSHRAVSRMLGRHPGAASGALWRARQLPRKPHPHQRTGGRFYKNQLNASLDDETYARVMAGVSKTCRLSERLRELIEWGLESEEQAS